MTLRYLIFYRGSSYSPVTELQQLGLFCIIFVFTSLIKEIFLERKKFKTSFCHLTGTKRGKRSRQRGFQTNPCKERPNLEHLVRWEGWILTPSILPPLEAHNIFMLESTSCWKCLGLQTCLSMHPLRDVFVRLSSLWNLHGRCSTCNQKKGYLAQMRTK